MLFIFFLASANSSPVPLGAVQHSSNISNLMGDSNPSAGGSNFSPRMDFAQWKPLTGRGDPLRNDPTYDYEPPVLERVHYWADEPRQEQERIPERKSEVLVLGVSSRKPSVVPRPPPILPQRTYRPLPPKFEDFTYKYSEYYPMTILVPPPPPPLVHQPSHFVMPEDKLPALIPTQKQPDRQILIKRPTVSPEHLSSFAVQEANLIYQSSTTNQNWFLNYNQTKVLPNSPVTSDYAGWGPTTPFDENDIINETHNFITNDHSIEISKPYLFYKPLPDSPKAVDLSEQEVMSSLAPTTVPPVDTTTLSTTKLTLPPTESTYDVATEKHETYKATTAAPKTTNNYFTTTALSRKPKPTLFDMLGPMMSMPIVADPDRPEDNLYAHASENIQIFKVQSTEENDDIIHMQSMQPPSSVKFPDITTVSERQPFHVNPHVLNNLLNAKPSVHTHDPYLHMRFTTPMTTSTAQTIASEEFKFTTEVPNIPMYLIIQGHSKVKTYSSKTKINPDDTAHNDISKKITNEVKHLHPLKEKKSKNVQIFNNTKRAGKAQDLKSLIDNGLGSIELQETDLGIKYDVSDGSEVPVELYKKGIVDSDENGYDSHNKNKRIKKQIELQDSLNFDDETIDEYVEDSFKRQQKESGTKHLSAESQINDITRRNKIFYDKQNVPDR
ncbi:zonadhesin-like isoform X2 [Battus philenor]